MKRYIYSIFVLVLFAFVGCVKTDEQDNNLARRGEVLLSLRTTSGLVTRATAEDIAAKEDTSLEERVDWVDVFVFEANGTDGAPGIIFHKERIDVSSAPVYKEGEFALAKKREEFREDIPYYVYLVANAKANLISDEVASWADLQNLVQTDQNLHFSAFVDAEGKPAFADAPARFLMDGFAYLGDAANPSASVAPEQMGTCVINDPDASEILLCGTIYRAAAKFIINIKQGANVEFQKELKGADNLDRKPQYYINQLPVSTRVLPQQATDYYIATTQNTATTGLNPYTFEWIDAKTAGASGDDGNKMTITGYGYSDDWSKLEYTKQTSMLFNLPMKWDKDKNAENGKEASTADNWYSIPLSKEKRFERNTCYTINVTVNAVGAEEKEYAIELKDIEYTTQPWNEVTVDIGGYDAAYLTLNTDLVKIYDTNIDKDQLTFASSSPIKSIRLADVYKHNADGTFQVVEKSATGAGDNYREDYAEGDGVWAYYIDKFGQSNQLGSDPGFDIKDVDHPEWTKAEILAKEKNLYAKEGAEKQYIRAEIWEGQEYALNGNITIHSPINAVADNDDLDWNSHFNTARYLEFVVENEQGITATFRVEQTPTVIITNEEGYFSYRDDQKFSDDQAEASHFHNYMGWQSFHLTGLMWGYEWDWTNNPNPQDEDFYVGNTSRDYSFVINDPNNVIANSLCEVIHYGNWGAPHTFIDSRPESVTYRYGGLYRSTTYPTGPFFRHRYYQFPGGQSTGVYKKQGYNISGRLYDHPRGDIQGLAIGPYYKRDGRTYRKQFVWNIQPIFYNLYVGEVFKENDSAAGRLKGQANIYSMTSSVTVNPGVMEGEWVSWGKQAFVNHRMYYVNTNNTHPNYTIGYPQITKNEVPKNTPENAKLMSPSLMVASQLGETYYQSIITAAAGYGYKVPPVGKIYLMAEEHCREYVETTFIDKPGADGKFNGKWDEGEEVIHYKDWRLPTKAEIDRIIDFQQSSRAMDKLLVGQYYFCITGNGEDADINVKENWVSNPVPDYIVGNEGYYIRCVRDVNRKK